MKSTKKEVIRQYCGKSFTKVKNSNIQRYPVIESIINLVNEFKQILKPKNAEKVEEWIEKPNNLKINKLFL
jgi:hypothetical protein